MKKKGMSFHPVKKHSSEFSCGMFVRYMGETARHGNSRRIIHGGIYTVAHAADDGPNCWLFVQELPGVRHCASGFAHTNHLAEDHWVAEYA